MFDIALAYVLAEKWTFVEGPCDFTHTYRAVLVNILDCSVPVLPCSTNQIQPLFSVVSFQHLYRLHRNCDFVVINGNNHQVKIHTVWT